MSSFVPLQDNWHLFDRGTQLDISPRATTVPRGYVLCWTGFKDGAVVSVELKWKLDCP